MSQMDGTAGGKPADHGAAPPPDLSQGEQRREKGETQLAQKASD